MVCIAFLELQLSGLGRSHAAFGGISEGKQVEHLPPYRGFLLSG